MNLEKDENRKSFIPTSDTHMDTHMDTPPEGNEDNDMPRYMPSSMPRSTPRYKITNRKVPWYYAPVFLLFWLILFIAVKHLIFFRLPPALSVANEASQPGTFIEERAKHILANFDGIGTKVLGSFANESLTLQLLLDEVEKIRLVMHDDLFDLHVDVQQVSGNFQHFEMINMYRGVQNLAVRFRAKNSTSQSYLLINSHFDSKPGSSAAGDDGAMVAVMLEILRVLATTRETFTHPIVFLFNGAEENGLQGAHGFITQHKWAKNCKVVINLDSCGSGHKELLFQSVSKYPWVMEYYRNHIKHPFATTVAEEYFEGHLIPSDTDFRIWKKYGELPGLDFAHVFNGYVYHTKFDKAKIIPKGSLQSTGDNMLSLARAFANAPELEDSGKYTGNNAVFFDFLGLFFIFYTQCQGQILNICLCMATITAIIVSMWQMGVYARMSIKRVGFMFLMIFSLHVVGIIFSFGLPLVMAKIFDSTNHSMTWFTNIWLVLGLYACPYAFGLVAPTLLHFNFRHHDKLSEALNLQLVLHSHCTILVIICIFTTALNVRSSYLLSISIIFYLCSIVFNLVTKLQQNGYYWVIPVIISQILPFLYFTFLGYTFLCTAIPMTGRAGSKNKPDMQIAQLTALSTFLAMGFLIPLLNIFRKPIMILSSLIVITFIFCIIAITPVGFPYRPETNVGRVQAFHVHRVFYEYDKSVSRNDSGYYFEYMDRRKHSLFKSAINHNALEKLYNNCEEYMMCGLPVLNRRWKESRLQNEWLPTENYANHPNPPKLTLTKRSTTMNAIKRARFEFELESSSFMGLFLQPLEGVNFTDWSFVNYMLQHPSKYQAPFHVHITAGKESEPLKFYVELETSHENFQEPLFKLGIYTHFVNTEYDEDEFLQFPKKFPDYLDVVYWPSSYERYIF